MFHLSRFGKNTCMGLEKHDFAISFEIRFYFNQNNQERL